MSETQRTIEEWRAKTFGKPPSLARMTARANEEMAELLRAVTTPDPRRHDIMMEVADVVIVLMGVAEITGGDLAEAVDAKMQINRRRRWNLTYRGRIRHDGAEPRHG